ncbi:MULTISPECIES: DsbA family protein [unclassified Micromonospora]|uniref:2-hydroxychromene-2-carboxylate isomerase n=1 Tax=unclassified Micromonospora TaxID=2617518 RepID=UPI001C217E30|nr:MULTISPECIES: DsbA family protein [unclassified Micromonospora]MBU8860459.1 DsbA family protein [Micromonospora sp. WMMB482]MDM4779996.1 DsbA family protein [Micromonospora sp. b486]
MTPKKQPRVHFSFRSPFSWLAITVLRRRVPDLDERVTFVPFWNPDAVTEAALRERGAELHYAPMSKAKHLYILHDTKRQAARVGVPMRWPIDDDPWWELPHLAWLCARRAGRARQFYEAACAARWERGEDICTVEAVERIAREAGLDPGPAARATDDPRIRAEAVDCLEQAYHDDIFGIPYFRIGRHRFWGLDRVDDFVAELEYPTPVRRPAPAGAARRIGAYDTDTAGGCG